MRIVSCTRRDAERQLLEQLEGWVHLGNMPQADRVRRALSELRSGRRDVTAGHTQFRISGGADSLAARRAS